MSKFFKLFESTKKNIISGQYGESGDKFLSVRDFALHKNIAYVTAIKIFQELRNEFYLILKGNNHYILNGICKENSLLYKSLNISYHRKKIGLHIKSLSNQFFTMLSKEIFQYISEFNIDLLILTSNNDSKQEINCLMQFLEYGCSGVLNFAGFKDKSLFDLYTRYPIPHIIIGRGIKDINLDFITTDNYESGVQAARYLYNCGYKDFAYLGLKTLQDDNDLRLLGFKKGLADMGYTLKQELIFNIDLEDTYDFVTLFIKKNCFPLGFFCYHDLLAIKLLNYLSYHKIEVPNSVGIIGYDDLPISSAVNPPLTTFSYNYSAFSKLIVDSMLNKIKLLEQTQKNHIFRTNLIIRKSTANIAKY